MSTAPALEPKAAATLEDEHESILDAPAPVGLSRPTLIRGVVTTVVVLALGFLVPSLISDPYYMNIAADGVVLGILAIGIGFLAHRSGLISLGHTAFYGGAAYGVAIAMAEWGWAPLQAAIFAVFGGTVLAVVIGALSIRITGMGFLMLTLAFAQAAYQLSILTSVRPVTGAFDGLGIAFQADQTFLGMDQTQLGAADTFWPLAWTALVLVTFGLWLVGRSRFGTVLEAIRENEERARFSGYNTYLPRLAAFTISGFCASIAGVLFALKASYVSPDVLSFITAGDALIAAIVGGFIVLAGPVVGAVLYIYAQGEFGDTGNLELYTGLALILVLIFLPGGITSFSVSLFHRLRAKARKERSRQ